jgi:hypothetical protein
MQVLHEFMTILAIKIGQRLGPLHATFSSGLFSHGTLTALRRKSAIEMTYSTAR